MPQIITGSGGVNRKAKQLTVGVGGANRKVKEAWAGVAGVNRKVFVAVNPNMAITLHAARRSSGTWTGTSGGVQDNIMNNPRFIYVSMRGRRYVSDTSSHISPIYWRGISYIRLDHCAKGDQVSYRTIDVKGCGSYRDVFVAASTYDRYDDRGTVLYQNASNYTTEKTISVTMPVDGYIYMGLSSGWAKEEHTLQMDVLQIAVNGIVIYPLAGQAEIPKDSV